MGRAPERKENQTREAEGVREREEKASKRSSSSFLAMISFFELTIQQPTTTKRKRKRKGAQWAYCQTKSTKMDILG